MKGNNGKKLIAGLASSLIFFGKNVYAASDATSSSSSGGKVILVVGGLALVLAILGLSYKMDKNADKEPKEPKIKKEKKSKKEKKLEKEETKQALNDNDVPYEAEQNEKYEPEKAETKSIQDEVEDTEFEEESLFPPKKEENTVKSDLDSTMVFNMNDEKEEVPVEEENSEYEIGDLDQKIDELDDLDDIDDDVVNKKMAELERNSNEVENPQDFLNNLKKYEQNADDFAGFSTKEENNNEDSEEVTSFSFGNINTEKNVNDNSTVETKNKVEHKKYTRKKSKEEKNKEQVENITDKLSSEIDDLPDITFTHEEDEKKEETENNAEPQLDIGFLNQMEQNLMKNQAARMNKNADKTKEKTSKKKK